MVYSHDSFIANSKTFSIVITIINSKTFSDSVAWFYIDCKGLLLGFISIVRGYVWGSMCGDLLIRQHPLVMLGGMPPSMIHEE